MAQAKKYNLKAVTANELKAAIDHLNSTNLVTGIARPGKASKAQLADSFIAGMDEMGAKDLLDQCPAEVWAFYNKLVPNPANQVSTGVAYEDAVAATPTKGKRKIVEAPEGTGKAAAKKGNGKKAAAKKAEPKEPPTPKFTKAMAFWRLLQEEKIWDKAKLAEALRNAHGNGSEAEAKFWTQNYCNLLVEAGVVSVAGTGKAQTVTVIEK